MGDFGLCRSVDSDDELSMASLKLAIKWMAIESLKSQEFSTMSDVYVENIHANHIVGLR